MLKTILQIIAYSGIFCLILMPLIIHFGLNKPMIILSISLTMGFIFGILNDILTELRKMNK